MASVGHSMRMQMVISPLQVNLGSAYLFFEWKFLQYQLYTAFLLSEAVKFTLFWDPLSKLLNIWIGILHPSDPQLDVVNMCRKWKLFHCHSLHHDQYPYIS